MDGRITSWSWFVFIGDNQVLSAVLQTARYFLFSTKLRASSVFYKTKNPFWKQKGLFSRGGRITSWSWFVFIGDNQILSAVLQTARYFLFSIKLRASSVFYKTKNPFWKQKGSLSRGGRIRTCDLPDCKSGRYHHQLIYINKKSLLKTERIF